MALPGDAGRVIGRYVLYDEIASGGMATIHLGRLIGQVGFARTVAIKRLHPQYARDPEFVAMFIDEARLAAGIRHPNVVSTLDVVALGGELFLVMEYVDGESLSHLIKAVRRQDARIPPRVVSSIVSNVLYGLHAAHVAKDDRGEPLEIVHRDISPQNILVGADGVSRVVDFGVAKAARRIMETEAGRIKGKFRYMSPEQLRKDKPDHRVDVFAAGIVLWEALSGRHLFQADDPVRIMTMILEDPIVPPSVHSEGLSPALDAVVLRALARDPDARYQTAREFAIELENALPPAVPRVVGEWVESLAGELLKRRADRLIELQSDVSGMGVDSVGQVLGSGGRMETGYAATTDPAPDRGLRAPSAAELALGSSPQAAPRPELVSAPQVALAERVADVPVAIAPAGSEPSQLQPPEPSSPSASSAPIAPQALARAAESQISDVSTAAWDTAAQRSLFPPRVQPKWIIVAAAAVSALMLLVIVLVRVTGSDETADAPSSSGPAELGVAPKPALPPAAPAAPAEPTPSAAKSTEPTAPAFPKPTRPADVASPKPAASAKPASKPEPVAEPEKPPEAPKPVYKPPADCNPPYTIDANGIKKFKRHCM